MKPTRSLWLRLAAGMGLLLFPCCLFALDPSKSIYQYNCQGWSRQYGLPANGINAIAQTRDGFLWLGTQKGLVRFDGTEFKTINLPNQPQFRGQVISSLAGSRDGALWFGIQMGFIGSYDEQGFSSPTNQPWADPALNVIAIRELSDGSVWAGTARGVARWDPANTNDTKLFDQVLNCTVICEGSHGRVWLGTSELGVFYWQNGKLTPFMDESLKNTSILAMTEDAVGNLWIGTTLGLRCYDSNFRPREIAGIDSWEEVRALITDRRGAVWLGTSGSGVARYLDGQITFLRRTNGLANDYVTALAEDQEGSIWIGTRNGLSQLSDVKLPIISTAEGLPSAFCHSVWPSHQGGVWASTSRGISRIDGKGITNFGSENGLSTLYVKIVFEAKNGDVYLVNGSRDVEILSKGQVIAKHSFTNWPTAFAEDAAGVIVAIGGDLYRIGPGQFDRYQFPPNKTPPFYWIRNLFTCPDGSILVGTVNGVFRVKNEQYEQWTLEQGLPDRDALWVCEDKEGVIWAGTALGIGRIKDNKVQTINRNDGLFDNSIQAIVPDNLGWLWISSRRGIFRARRQNLQDFAEGKTNRVDCIAYDGLESVKTIDTTEVEYSGCQLVDGRVCFPSPLGVIMISPDNIFVNRVAPPVHIQRILANGMELVRGARSPVPAGKGELEFQYAAASFIAPQKVQFRYQLEGYDPEWVFAGIRRSAFYTNLKPGHYRFRVQACNADGIWETTGDAFEIKLPPLFYQTAWFRALYGLFAIISISGIYRWRVKHLEQRQRNLQETNEKLESKVRERTGELAQQRNLLRTLIDHLPDNVFVKDIQSRIILNNVAHAQNLGAPAPDAVVGKTDFDFFPKEVAQKFYNDEQKLLESGQSFNGEEQTVNCSTGQERWTRTTKVPLHDDEGKIIGIAGINRDITEQKQWEARLESLHRQLIETSRQAGMAEVATNVLHNVGNVLNSVNVSASLVEEKVKNSAAADFLKVLTLLHEHESDLASFLSENDKGKKLIAYMDAVAKNVGKERSRLLDEMNCLGRNLEHMKEIVAMQQTYARVAGVLEIVNISEVVEDALRMNEAAYERHGIKVIRQFSQTQAISIDRHKAIQILVNLFQNAKYACGPNPAENRCVTVEIGMEGTDRVKVMVTDNGMGIPLENLTRIFSHGFTTRRDGHGFGLHSGALAAKEMGGSLTAFSEGRGKGAKFILELPVEQKPPSPRKTIESTIGRERTIDIPGASPTL